MSRSRLLSFAAIRLWNSECHRERGSQTFGEEELGRGAEGEQGEDGNGGTKPQRPSEVRMDMHREAVMGLAMHRGIDPMLKHIKMTAASFTGKGRGYI